MNERSTRVQRVERELLQMLSRHLLHELGAPLPCYASISAVEVSPDLRNAKVYFRLVGDAKLTAQAESQLERERGLFQKTVSRELKLKFCPVLRFTYGQVEKRDDIDVLLENMKKPRRMIEDED